MKWTKETQQRLQTALNELNEYGLYDYLVVNDNLQAASADLRCLYVAFCRQMTRNEDKIKKLIRGRI